MNGGFLRVRDRPAKILIVEPEPEFVELLVASLARRFNAHLTCVADGHSCLDVELSDPHDLVITDFVLDDMNGITLTQQLRSISQRPVLLLAYEPTPDQAVDAVRAGVADLFRKPFPIDDLLDTTQRLLREYSIQKQRSVKYARMRDLVRRVIRERRELNRRIELVCRDLVGAHRRLVHRVLDMEESRTPDGA